MDLILFLSRSAYVVWCKNKNSFAVARKLKKLVILLKYFSVISYMNAFTRKCSQFRETSAQRNFSRKINWKIWERVGRGKREDYVCSIGFLFKIRRQRKSHTPMSDAGILVVKTGSYWGNILQKRNSEYFACMEAAIVMERQLLSLYPRHHDIQVLWSLNSCFANDCILFCLKLNSNTHFQENIC